MFLCISYGPGKQHFVSNSEAIEMINLGVDYHHSCLKNIFVFIQENAIQGITPKS